MTENKNIIEEVLVDLRDEVDAAKSEAKRLQFEELLQKQQQERDIYKEQKKVRDDTHKDPKERMLTIQKEFRTQYEKLQAMIKSFNKQTTDVSLYFEAFNQLKEYFVQSNYALTTFDKQQYKEQLEKVEKTIYQARDLSKPRRKFKFSQKICTNAAPTIDPSTLETIASKDFGEDIPGLINLEGKTIVINEGEDNEWLKPSSTIRLVDISNCSISLNSIYDTVYIRNISNSTINIGPVKFSLLIDNITNSTINISGHQLRIHNSKNTKFGIFTTSKCIIEHCTEITFTPYHYTYPNFQKNFEQSGMSEKTNLWKEVQDFNWLKQEASPNFTLKEE